MTAQPEHAMAPRDWLLLLALAACFSGSFFFNRVALAELPPLTIVLGRVGLGQWRSTWYSGCGASACRQGGRVGARS
jgi:hypothetical protein